MVTTFPKISLVEKGKTISYESTVANSFSISFENVIRSLDIKANKHSQEDHLKNPVEIAIKIFYQHPYILLPKILLTIKNYFSIAHHENILKEIINLDNKKMELLKTFLLAESRMSRCV